MTLYSGSGYDPYGSDMKMQIAGPMEGSSGFDTDFAGYRIKWTADVESFFNKKQQQPSASLAHAEERENAEKGLPLRKTSSFAIEGGHGKTKNNLKSKGSSPSKIRTAEQKQV